MNKHVYVLRWQSWEMVRLLLVTPDLEVAQRRGLERLRQHGVGNYSVSVQRGWRRENVSVHFDQAKVDELVGRLRWKYPTGDENPMMLYPPEADRDRYPTWTDCAMCYMIESVEYVEGMA